MQPENRKWRAQAHDRHGWYNEEADTYIDLRRILIGDCKAGRVWGPLYITDPDGREHDMTKAYAEHGLRTEARPEPQIDEDEEARAEEEYLDAHAKAREAEWDLWESMKEACY